MAPTNYYQPQQPQLVSRPPPSPSEFSDELDPFIVDVLKKQQERIFLLKLEKDLRAFIANTNEQRLDLPQMNSYQRMMVHKVAPYFKLYRVYDPVRKSLVLCKNPYTTMSVQMRKWGTYLAV
ncbi:single-stranded nucleic acid binding R3H [Dichotomocladium elegans]|nr:single-stranded nucleic acid binding R3H [Dichotomocladium elegans]